MSSAPPLRHVREIVGVFVLLAIGLVLAALVLIGRGRGLFESRAELDVTFPAERAAVLRPGVQVKLAGEAIGKVVGVVRGGETIRARLSVMAPAREVLRADARALLRVPIAGLVGELGIELDAGAAPAPWPEGKVLVGEAEGDPAVKARETVEQVREQVPLILARTQAILDKADAILGQVKDRDTAGHADELIRSVDRLARAVEREQAVAHATRVLAEAEALLKDVRDGGGTTDKLLHDPALFDRTAAILDDLHRSWPKLESLVGATTRIAERAGELAERARGRTDELEALLGETQLVVLQANRAMELLNNHWLLRGTLPEPAAPVPPGVIDWAPGDLAGAPAPAAGGRP
jgi:ABC-type transporter Mla subunit MlaD